MEKFINQIKAFIESEAIVYILSRYATYFIQFINSLFIAAFLGPYYLGVWGFIQMIISYLAVLNLGIPNSVNNTLSIFRQDSEFCKKIAGNGLTILIILSVFITVFFFVDYSFNIFKIGVKYDFKVYSFFVCIIAIIGYFNSYYSNLFRIYGKLKEVVLNQSLFTVLVLLIIFIFKGKDLLWGMLFINIISVIIPFFIFIYRSPIRIKPLFDWTTIKKIQKKGWFLFIYTISYTFILLSTKTFITKYYSVEEFGYFTFSFSLANAILLLMNAIAFLISPKMLNRFATSNINQTQNILQNLRSVYISTSHLLMHFVIMIFPVLLLFFPDYKESHPTFILIGLTLVLFTNSFGFQYIISAKEKDKEQALISLCTLILNVFLLLILTNLVQTSYEYIILATMISYFIFVLIIGIYAQIILNIYDNILISIVIIFPFRMMIPFLISLIFVFLTVAEIFYIIPFVLYILLNYRDVARIKNTVIKIINNPNFINI